MSSSKSQGARPIAYISGPLQAAVDIGRARHFYELLAEVCSACGCEAYLPHQRTDPVYHAETSALSTFIRDFNAVSAADVIVAYVGTPSTGVGAELGIAHERRIPVIALCGPEGVASRFIEGLLDSAPEARLVRYRDEDECCRLLSAELGSFVERRTQDSCSPAHKPSQRSAPLAGQVSSDL